MHMYVYLCVCIYTETWRGRTEADIFFFFFALFFPPTKAEGGGVRKGRVHTPNFAIELAGSPATNSAQNLVFF